MKVLDEFGNMVEKGQPSAKPQTQTIADMAENEKSRLLEEENRHEREEQGETDSEGHASTEEAIQLPPAFLTCDMKYLVGKKDSMKARDFINFIHTSTDAGINDQGLFYDGDHIIGHIFPVLYHTYMKDKSPSDLIDLKRLDSFFKKSRLNFIPV